MRAGLTPSRLLYHPGLDQQMQEQLAAQNAMNGAMSSAAMNNVLAAAFQQLCKSQLSVIDATSCIAAASCDADA
jgi:hypothetical protein